MSAVSIASNVAEGYECNSHAEFKRFLLIAKGSCGELRTQLYILKAPNLSLEYDIDSLIEECKELSAIIQGLVSYLTELIRK